MEDRSLIEGADYYLRFVQFPNRANPGAVIENDDGTYDIYINTLYYPDSEWVRKILQHEINHIILGHFEVLDLTIQEIEEQAG